MDEYQLDLLRKEDNNRSSDEVLLRKACKVEIDELWNKKDEGPVKFLKLLE